MAIKVVGVMLAACLFGAGDLHLQRMGGSTGFWLSNMSAFWLVLAFVAGRLMPSWRSAAVLGLVTTQVALVAFYIASWPALPHEAWHYAVGGLITGPVFGAFGWRWATDRWWPGAAALSAAFCCEPYAWRRYKGYLPTPTYVWRLEIATGLILAGWFTLLALRRETADSPPSRPWDRA